ncbi:hypothetical protein D3C76_1756650 [compost metagenome]
MILLQFIAAGFGDHITLLHVRTLLHIHAGQALIDGNQTVGVGDFHLIADQRILFHQGNLAA